MYGRVTQGRAREFLMYNVKQLFEDIVVLFPSDARGYRLRPENDGNISYTYRHQEPRVEFTTNIFILS